MALYIRGHYQGSSIMLNTTKAAGLPQISSVNPEVRKNPFVIPSPQKDEAVESYITAVKANAPLEYFTLGGITFEKAVLPEKASLVSMSEKQKFFPQLPCKLMTKSQAEAIWAEAAKRTVYIPYLKNPSYNPKVDTPDKQHIQGGYFELSECMILEPERSFDQRKYPSINTPWQPVAVEVTPEEVKAQLILQQRQEPSQGKKK